jgi:hypothetical protein
MLCTIRKDLLEDGLKVPVMQHGNLIFIQPKYPIEYRWNNEVFQIKLGDEWCDAMSIDFDFIGGENAHN